MRISLSFGILLLLGLVSACGGGTSDNSNPGASSQSSLSSSNTSSSNSSPSSTRVLTGTLVGAIKGLRYTTETQSGETNANGEFNYLEGETISFSIGDIKLPSITAKSMVSAYSFANDENLDNLIAMNISRLIQTLDQDGLYDNGVEITSMVHNLAAGISLEFNSPNFDDQVANLISTSGAANRVLVDVEIAQNNLMTSISGCTKNHPNIGQVANFTTRSHGVTGKATIINDCTIKITNFSYDGLGIDVRFYGGLNGNFRSGLSLGEQLVGKRFNKATYLLPLNSGELDRFNSLSVWCVDVNVSFGDGTFVRL